MGQLVSRQLIIRFVCTNDGGHKERSVGFPVVARQDDNGEIQLGVWDKRQGQAQPLTGGPRRALRGMQELEFHLDDTGSFREPEPDLEDKVAHREWRARAALFRPRLTCSSCSLDVTLSEDNIRALAERYIGNGGRCTVNVSTGAIVHKQ